jgi:sugar/nucleoside kinase (ribokinase family)
MRSKPTDAVSIGEIMIESIFHIAVEPSVNSTVVVKGQNNIPELGGAAVNVAWYLGSLGKSVRLVAPISSRQFGDLSKEINGSQIELSGLMRVKGNTDHLITLLSPNGHRSIYMLGEIPSDLKRKTLNHVKAHRVIIMNGGRHREIREIFREITLSCPDKVIVYNPSYAVYEYSNNELAEIMKGCDICFFNEDEYSFVKEQVGKAIEGMPRRALIVTRSSKGAWMFANNRQFSFKSLLNRKGIFLGAGDACLAGFITGFLDKVSLEQALNRGMRLAALVVERNKIRTEISKADILAIVGA